MTPPRRRAAIVCLSLLLGATSRGAEAGAGPTAGAAGVTILYTNDFHSAFDPVPPTGSPFSGWRAAHLSTLVNQIRGARRPSFSSTAATCSRGCSLSDEGRALMG